MTPIKLNWKQLPNEQMNATATGAVTRYEAQMIADVPHGRYWLGVESIVDADGGLLAQTIKARDINGAIFKDAKLENLEDGVNFIENVEYSRNLSNYQSLNAHLIEQKKKLDDSKPEVAEPDIVETNVVDEEVTTKPKSKVIKK